MLKGLFSRPSPEDNCIPAVIQEVDPMIMEPVHNEDVAAALKTTSGCKTLKLYGRNFSNSHNLGFGKLLWLVNIVHWLGTQPESWLKGKTIVITQYMKRTSLEELRFSIVILLITKTVNNVLSRRINITPPMFGR